MTTKCAKLTECDMTEYQDNNVVVYNAKACNGDEKFNYLSSGQTLGDTCPANQLVEVDYDPEGCSRDNFCEADSMTLATDCGVF